MNQTPEANGQDRANIIKVNKPEPQEVIVIKPDHSTSSPEKSPESAYQYKSRPRLSRFIFNIMRIFGLEDQFPKVKERLERV